MFENIANFFKKLVKAEKKDSPSKDTAKERLHLVLMQDRANVSADFMELMKQEIIEVIKKYIDVEESAIDVRLTNEIGEDGTKGAPALYANIPIKNIKNGIKNEVEKELVNNNKQDNKKKIKEENKETVDKKTEEENKDENKKEESNKESDTKIEEKEEIKTEKVENKEEENEITENEEEKEIKEEIKEKTKEKVENNN